MHAAVLRYVDEVARLGSIRRAAALLNIASSAVNRQILKLESQIGTPLFERRRSGVKPTAAGEALLRHIRETMTDYQRTRAEIAGLSGAVTGEVRIIALESLLLRFMPLAIEELSARYPDVTFTVLSVDPSGIAEELRSGRSDFGVLFVDKRHRGIDVAAEIRTSIGAVMAPSHPLAGRRRLTLTDCAAYPVVMLHDRWLLDAIMATEFAKSGARLSPRIISNSTEFMRQVMLAGLGIGFFTPVGFIEEIRRGQLVHVPLAEPRLGDSQIGILVPRAKRLSPPARLALEHIGRRLKEFAGELASARPTPADVPRSRASATRRPMAKLARPGAP
ncbi:MAG: LysR family transcriptional regulator [Proteobacteria bacterium]|nr:LysR family transcriptional regulator [Pseudomonadota bacterium]MBI3497919.1 LysR family transcriptional regulator [Pseudomonadota bacterium]